MKEARRKEPLKGSSEWLFSMEHPRVASYSSSCMALGGGVQRSMKPYVLVCYTHRLAERARERETCVLLVLRSCELVTMGFGLIVIIMVAVL